MILYKDSEYKIRELFSKADAAFYGKGRGWCTSDLESNHYDKAYNKNKGRLFLVYKNLKRKPDYQLFISKRGTVEFRSKFNKREDSNMFFSDGTLLTWFMKVFKETKTEDVDYSEALTELSDQYTPIQVQESVYSFTELNEVTDVADGTMVYSEQENSFYVRSDGSWSKLGGTGYSIS